MTSLGAAIIEAVAQALSFAVHDPQGHCSATSSFCQDLNLSTGGKKRRGAEETLQVVTVFDSSVVPPIGIDKYLMRLAATFRCSEAAFVAALIVVDRLLGYDGGRLPLTMRNVHRVFLGSLVVSVKFHEDLVYSNSHYAKAGGVHLREVNRLERVLLSALDFDLRVEPEEYKRYEAMLLSGYANSPKKFNQLPIAGLGPSQNNAGGANQLAVLAAVIPPVRVQSETSSAAYEKKPAEEEPSHANAEYERKGRVGPADRGARRRSGRGGSRGSQRH
jgi:hypothetical protein